MNLLIRLVLPTPVSPTKMNLKAQSYLLLCINSFFLPILLLFFLQIPIYLMKASQLTIDGIENMFKGESVIIQIIQSSVQKTSALQTEEFLQATLSDGFCFIRKAWISMKYFPKRNYQFAVIKIQAAMEKGKKRKDGATPSFIINANQFQIILTGLKESIGKPIPYKEYYTNGKINNLGSRQIPMEQDTEDDFDFISSNLVGSQPSKNNKKIAAKPKKPIEEIPQKRSSIKPQINHDVSDAEKIKDLFLGLEAFKIIARLLFVWPIKVITNKKGTQSELLNLEFGDSSGSIMCTVFGQNANKYANLQPDKVFSISGATVTESSYRGKKQIKLNFNDGTKLLMLDTSLAPKLQHFCVSVKQLQNADKGEVLSVICCLKEGESSQFISKQGNKIIKKTLHLYDLQHQVSCELTLINEKACIDYPEGMYALKGVEVDEFQGNKQFKANLVFVARLLPRHPLSKHISKVSDMEFTSMNSNNKTTRKAMIDNFIDLKLQSENLQQKQNLWSEVVCSLKTIRYGSSKTSYLSCPFCKKKINSEQGQQCIHCGKRYNRGKYRYILQVNLLDCHESIWASAYDDIGQKLLALENEECYPADKFNELNQQQMKARIHALRYKHLKVKMVTAKEEFNSQLRVKHKIVKLLDLNYGQECQGLMKKILNFSK